MVTITHGPASAHEIWCIRSELRGQVPDTSAPSPLSGGLNVRFPQPNSFLPAEQVWSRHSWEPPSPNEGRCSFGLACLMGAHKEPATGCASGQDYGGMPRASIHETGQRQAYSSLLRKKTPTESGDRPSQPQVRSVQVGDEKLSPFGWNLASHALNMTLGLRPSRAGRTKFNVKGFGEGSWGCA